MTKFVKVLVVLVSLAGTLISLIAGVIIVRNYIEDRATARLIAKDPQSVKAQVERIKGTLAEIESLAGEVDTLGSAATEAQRRTDEARALVNMSEEEIAALERRLNPAAGIWLNIGIGVVMLFVGYFLEKFLDRVLNRDQPKVRHPASPEEAREIAGPMATTEPPVIAEPSLVAESGVIPEPLATAEPSTAAKPVAPANPVKAVEA